MKITVRTFALLKNILYLSCGGGYMGIYTCRKASKCTIKYTIKLGNSNCRIKIKFIVCKFYLNESILIYIL